MSSYADPPFLQYENIINGILENSKSFNASLWGNIGFFTDSKVKISPDVHNQILRCLRRR